MKSKTKTKTIKIATSLLPHAPYGTKKSAKTTIPALPEGIEVADLERPSYRARGGNKSAYDATNHRSYDFELWHSEGFGWCIPTLHIGTTRRISQSYSAGERTYAVRVATGETVRIGNGPHVTARLKVYVRVKRVDELRKFFDLQLSGSTRANEIRDTISTRRAQSALRRRWY